MPLPLLTIPLIGVGAKAILGAFLRVGFIQTLIGLAIYAVAGIAGYFLFDWLLPSWFSLSFLSASIATWHPGIHYALSLIAFFDGLSLLFWALVSAWVMKKFPPSVWLGPIFRAFRA